MRGGTSARIGNQCLRAQYLRLLLRLPATAANATILFGHAAVRARRHLFRVGGVGSQQIDAENKGAMHLTIHQFKFERCVEQPFVSLGQLERPNFMHNYLLKCGRLEKQTATVAEQLQIKGPNG